MVVDPHRSLSTNPMNLENLLQVTLSRFTSQPPFSLQLVDMRPPIDLLSVYLFNLLSISFNLNLPSRTTSTF
jgi:hypothetical protein